MGKVPIPNKGTWNLFEGDAYTWLATFPKDSVQLVVTSPPYNIGKIYEGRPTALNTYLAGQERVIDRLVGLIKPGGSICWQVGTHLTHAEIFPLDIFFYPMFKSRDMRLRSRIVWTYGHGLHAKHRFSGRYETIMWFTKGVRDDYLFNLDAVRVPQEYPGKKYYKGLHKGELSCHPLGKNPGDIWDIPNVKNNHPEKVDHPCQFPIELVERLILALSNEGDQVLDPYCGAGSTLIAAIRTGRAGYGIELCPEYCEVTRQRVRDYLCGRHKVRESGPPKK